MPVQGHFTLVPLLFETTSRYLSIQPHPNWHLRETSWNTTPWLGLFPYRPQNTRWSVDVMGHQSFILHHWFGWVYTGDIHSTEIWLIDGIFPFHRSVLCHGCGVEPRNPPRWFRAAWWARQLSLRVDSTEWSTIVLGLCPVLDVK